MGTLPEWYAQDEVLQTCLREKHVDAGVFLDSCLFLSMSPALIRRIAITGSEHDVWQVIIHATELCRKIGERDV